jgi:TrmH family RNA methyltransferase
MYNNRNEMVKYMGSISMDNLLQKYKNKIKYIGAQHEKVNEIKHILKSAGSILEKFYIAEGIWAHQRILMSDKEIQAFVFCPEYIYSEEAIGMVKIFIARANEVYVVSKRVFEKLSDRDEPDGFMSIGIFNTCELDKLQCKNDAIIIVLDGLEKPGNIGTILRTCDGAGVDAVFICNKKARMTNPKLIKGSMGGFFPYL